MNTPLYLAGTYGVNGTSNKVVTTTGSIAVTSGNLFEVQNGGIIKAAVAVDGTLTTATPIPQTSGGTGVGSTTCSAGQFLTSNGTTYSCAAAPAGAILVYGQVASNGVIVRQAGAPVVSVNHSFGVGIYDVTVTGMTTSAVVLATAGHITSSGSMIAVDVGHDHTGAAFAGFAVTTSNGANSANDVAFHFAVLAL